jgi:hypothetical protein
MSTAISSKRGSPAKTAPQQNQSARPGHAQPLIPSSRNKDNNIRNKVLLICTERKCYSNIKKNAFLFSSSNNREVIRLNELGVT